MVTPSGLGDHLWLEVCKRNSNTDWVGRQLAKACGCAARDVGYAGLKDRKAVTTQWFSLPLNGKADPEWLAWDIENVVILQAARHARKLKRGALCGNRFELTLRDVRGSRPELETRLGKLARNGFPNYFGPQRFGRAGRNIEHATRWLKQVNPVRARMSRHLRGLYMSALRSLVFNDVLSVRVQQGTWNQLLDGELAMLNGVHSVFECALPDELLEQRCAGFDIHPSGPLPGKGELSSVRQAALIEQGVLERFDWQISALDRLGVTAARRSLRVVAHDLQWSMDDNILQLGFSLPAGAYATSLLRELILMAPPVGDGSALSESVEVGK